MLFWMELCELILCHVRVCQKVRLEERPKVYRAVDEVLDLIAYEINDLLKQENGQWAIFLSLAGKSIAERL